jgi:hypothetical protein
MTERLVIKHDFDCSEKGFWDTFLSEKYNFEMFREHMKFPRWELRKFEVTELEALRVIDVEPYLGPLPAPAKKLLGDKIGYQEEGRLDRKKNRYDFKIIPGKLQDKIFVSGAQFTESLGENRCRRIFEATIEIRVFAVGSLIERHVAQDLKKSYDVGATFTQGYMREHGVT